MTENIWIVGCGDIGLRLAKLYPPGANKIKGIVRSESSVKRCAREGIDVIVIDLDADDFTDSEALRGACIYYFAPPPATGTTDTRINRFLDYLGNAAKRLVLISTTGVYGDQNGAWVNETTPVKPVAERAIRRLSAEQSAQQWAEKYNRETIILRVPGIYAADRLPLTRLQKKLPVVRESEAPWTNRIHADDLALVCKTAMELKHSNTVYNVSDGQPSTMTEYFNQVADFAGLSRPPQISLEEAIKSLSPGMVSYLKESRRVSNRKILEELNISLQYPSLKEGLRK